MLGHPEPVPARGGYLAISLDLYLARSGGDRRTARVFPARLAAAWTALIAGMAIESLTEIGVGLIVERAAGPAASGPIRVLMIAAVVALLGSAAVVMFTSRSDAVPAPAAPVVEDRPIVGGADVLERQAESDRHDLSGRRR